MTWQRHPQCYQPNMWKWLVVNEDEVQNCNPWSVIEGGFLFCFVFIAKSP